MKKILCCLVLAVLFTPALVLADDDAKEFEKWLTEAVQALRKVGWTGFDMKREQKGEKQFYRVSNISPESPAGEAGLRLGDVLLSLNVVSLMENDYWGALKAGHIAMKPGQTLSFVVSRQDNGEWSKETINLKMEKAPDDYVARILGTQMMMKLGLIEEK